MNAQKLTAAAVTIGAIVALASPVLVVHYFESRQERLPGAEGLKERPAPPEKPALARTATAQVKKGEVAFNRNCATCHQLGGVGKVGVAPSIRNRDFLALASDAFIKKTVREGRPGTAMVPRRDISNEDLNHIIAYLRALPVANPLVVEVDPNLRFNGDPDKGRPKFAIYCASCHGPNGEGYTMGGSGPGIGLEGFLSVASDDYIFKTIQYGRTGTPMRAFLGSRGLANLNEADVHDIIAFLRRQDPSLEPHYAEERGEETYNRNCGMCHKPGGAGEVGVAPSIGNRDFLALASDEFIKHTVRKGRLGTAMAPRKDLTERELDNIIAYLRSLPASHPAPIEVDPSVRFSGNSTEGQTKFTTYCAPCHGARGEGYIMGGSGPGIGLPGFLNTVPDDYIFKTVKYGRTGTPMRPFIGSRGLAYLNEADVHDIIAFLRSRVVLP